MNYTQGTVPTVVCKSCFSLGKMEKRNFLLSTLKDWGGGLLSFYNVVQYFGAKMAIAAFSIYNIYE